ncbi:hypothetical protein HK100_011753 [Physocladia obscura]|uniref:Uncharacterized protein n=1 Tax=Physocladia obscura TaxID=109957 RepID=A0AAD5T6S0_9FUNG|nr:hypothetical protein HK100_011753 [Physocladia obscura]
MKNQQEQAKDFVESSVTNTKIKSNDTKEFHNAIVATASVIMPPKMLLPNPFEVLGMVQPLSLMTKVSAPTPFLPVSILEIENELIIVDEHSAQDLEGGKHAIADMLSTLSDGKMTRIRRRLPLPENQFLSKMEHRRMLAANIAEVFVRIQFLRRTSSFPVEADVQNMGNKSSEAVLATIERKALDAVEAKNYNYHGDVHKDSIVAVSPEQVDLNDSNLEKVKNNREIRENHVEILSDSEVQEEQQHQTAPTLKNSSGLSLASISTKHESNAQSAAVSVAEAGDGPIKKPLVAVDDVLLAIVRTQTLVTTHEIDSAINELDEGDIGVGRK